MHNATLDWLWSTEFPTQCTLHSNNNKISAPKLAWCMPKTLEWEKPLGDGFLVLSFYHWRSWQYKNFNIQGHKNHTEHSSHSTLFHSNTPTRIAMVHNAVPTQLTQSISTMCLYIPPFIYAHCQSAHNLLPKSISVTHSASYNISTTITKLYSKQQTQWEIKQY